jgi:hypothetical protein
MSTVSQISSAALLAIPGVFFAASTPMPDIRHGWLLYAGIISFGLSLVAAMLEQHLSAIAYERQIEVVQAYYTKQSTEREHPVSLRRVKKARRAAYLLFALALIMSSLGLILL